MLKLSKTFEVITEESASIGDTDERGFEWQGVEHTFRGTVELLRYREPSQHPITDPASCWFTEDEGSDFRTGDTRQNAIHLDRGQRAKCVLYWSRAIRAAGHKMA